MDTTRFWQLDILKGIAIIFVVIYHAVFDLAHFTTFNIDPTTWFWSLIGRTAASLFIFSSGISLALSIHKAEQKNGSYQRIYIRAAKLLGIASVITLITAIIFDEGTILFGILHFLAIASLIGIPCYNLGIYNIFLSAFIFLFSFFIIEQISISSSYLIWLGIAPSNFLTFDYFPIFPWFGLYNIGLYIGKQFYIAQQPLKAPSFYQKVFSPLCFLGQHTLIIYLIHQPILFGLGYFFLKEYLI